MSQAFDEPCTPPDHVGVGPLVGCQGDVADVRCNVIDSLTGFEKRG